MCMSYSNTPGLENKYLFALFFASVKCVRFGRMHGIFFSFSSSSSFSYRIGIEHISSRIFFATLSSCMKLSITQYPEFMSSRTLLGSIGFQKGDEEDICKACRVRTNSRYDTMMLPLSLSLSLSSFSRTKKSSPLHSFTPLLLFIVRSVATQTHNNNKANANNSLTARPTTPEECVENFQDTFFCKYLGSPTLILLNTKDLLFSLKR